MDTIKGNLLRGVDQRNQPRVDQGRGQKESSRGTSRKKKSGVSHKAEEEGWMRKGRSQGKVLLGERSLGVRKEGHPNQAGLQIARGGVAR